MGSSPFQKTFQKNDTFLLSSHSLELYHIHIAEREAEKCSRKQ
jgi:hypothetical protein